MQSVSILADETRGGARKPVIATVAKLLLYIAVLAAVGDACAQWVRGAQWNSRLPGRDRGASLAWLAALLSLSVLFIAQFLALELAPTIDEVAMLARQTAWGRGWLVLAAVAVTGTVAAMGRAPLALRLSTGMAMAVAMGGLGHAAADEGAPLLSRALDATHMIAVALWIGTLLHLRTERSIAVWERFSRIATIAAPLAVLAGAGSALRRLNGSSLSQVAASDYGRMLAAKLVVVGLILALGGVHRRQARRREVPGTQSVRVELILAFAVLAVTAVLTGTAPPGE